MFELNLQLFGGGGSKSGLGGGGGGNTWEEYTFGFKKADGSIHTEPFRARNEDEARRKAEKYRKEEGYKVVSRNFKKAPIKK